jgi:hypothetical protein
MQCLEQDYIMIINHISHKLYQVVKLNDLSLLNKHARRILLDAIAHTPFSEFFTEFEAH